MGTEMWRLNDGSLGTNTGTSHKKIEANRQNAQSSTGPKTREGKKTVSLNAIEHGLLAKDVVITAGDRKEDQAEFDALLAELRDYYMLVGVEEDLLIQEIASSYWRSARALRCERGELTLWPTIGEVRSLIELENSIRALRTYDEVRYELFGSSLGLEYVIQKLQEARKEVEYSRALSPETSKWLYQHVGGSWEGHSSKQALLAALDAKTTELSARKVMIEEIELRQKDVRLDSSAIPSMEALNRITRYETTNVRHRERVMQILERFQSQRKQSQKAIPGAGDDGEGGPQNG